ncbi:unnamed protein product [Symbiodinium sp. CCMP2456]|nr:unnamed protein product [Symbiodinium sp. CCMP2456]
MLQALADLRAGLGISGWPGFWDCWYAFRCGTCGKTTWIQKWILHARLQSGDCRKVTGCPTDRVELFFTSAEDRIWSLCCACELFVEVAKEEIRLEEDDGEAGASLKSPPSHLYDPWSFPPFEEEPEADFADADPEEEAAEEIPEPAREAEPRREEPLDEVSVNGLDNTAWVFILLLATLVEVIFKGILAPSMPTVCYWVYKKCENCNVWYDMNFYQSTQGIIYILCSFALIFVVAFERVFQDYLHGIQPYWKFWGVKIVVSVTYFQWLLFKYGFQMHEEEVDGVSESIDLSSNFGSSN